MDDTPSHVPLSWCRRSFVLLSLAVGSVWYSVLCSAYIRSSLSPPSAVRCPVGPPQPCPPVCGSSMRRRVVSLARRVRCSARRSLDASTELSVVYLVGLEVEKVVFSARIDVVLDHRAAVCGTSRGRRTYSTVRAGMNTPAHDTTRLRRRSGLLRLQ